MFWYRKTYPRYGAHWVEDQNEFEKLLMCVAAKRTDDYKQMLMVTVEDEQGDTEDVYLRVPSREHIQPFAGYEACTGPQRASSLLVGHQPEFERQFR
jgi:hypothetical protein